MCDNVTKGATSVAISYQLERSLNQIRSNAGGALKEQDWPINADYT